MRTTHLLTVAIACLACTGAAHAQNADVNEPITFLGINAFMSEAEITSALSARGYSCSVRDEEIPRLAKLNCSKRMGDNPVVPNAGAYANVSIRRASGEIEIMCLAIADGLGDEGVVTCKDKQGASHHPRMVVNRLGRSGVLKRNFQAKRTGENAACFTGPAQDKLCVEYSDFSKQTRMVMTQAQ